jgi:hypothetical protein
MPLIDYVKDRRVHVFVCGARHCKGNGKYGQYVRRFLDTGDAKLTSNLRRHAKGCWGDETVKAAGKTKDVFAACDAMAKATKKDGSILSAFGRIKQNQATYSHRQHTSAEVRVEVVRWVAENMWPFLIVNDRSFRKLMKTGRPDYRIPSPHTVLRDVKNVFVHCRQRIATILQVCITLVICSQLKSLLLKYIPGARWMFELCY